MSLLFGLVLLPPFSWAERPAEELRFERQLKHLYEQAQSVQAPNHPLRTQIEELLQNGASYLNRLDTHYIGLKGGSFSIPRALLQTSNQYYQNSGDEAFDLLSQAYLEKIKEEAALRPESINPERLIQQTLPMAVGKNALAVIRLTSQLLFEHATNTEPVNTDLLRKVSNTLEAAIDLADGRTGTKEYFELATIVFTAAHHKEGLAQIRAYLETQAKQNPEKFGWAEKFFADSETLSETLEKALLQKESIDLALDALETPPTDCNGALNPFDQAMLDNLITDFGIHPDNIDVIRTLGGMGRSAQSTLPLLLKHFGALIKLAEEKKTTYDSATFRLLIEAIDSIDGPEYSHVMEGLKNSSPPIRKGALSFLENQTQLKKFNLNRLPVTSENANDFGFLLGLFELTPHSELAKDYLIQLGKLNPARFLDAVERHTSSENFENNPETHFLFDRILPQNVDTYLNYLGSNSPALQEYGAIKLKEQKNERHFGRPLSFWKKTYAHTVSEDVRILAAGELIKFGKDGVSFLVKVYQSLSYEKKLALPTQLLQVQDSSSEFAQMLSDLFLKTLDEEDDYFEARILKLVTELKTPRKELIPYLLKGFRTQLAKGHTNWSIVYGAELSRLQVAPREVLPHLVTAGSLSHQILSNYRTHLLPYLPRFIEELKSQGPPHDGLCSCSEFYYFRIRALGKLARDAWPAVTEQAGDELNAGAFVTLVAIGAPAQGVLDYMDELGNKPDFLEGAEQFISYPDEPFLTVFLKAYWDVQENNWSAGESEKEYFRDLESIFSDRLELGNPSIEEKLAELPHFIRMIEDPKLKPGIRASAIHYVGALGKAATPAVPALMKLQVHPDEEIRKAANDVIGKIHTPSSND